MKKYYIILISILFCANIYSQEKIITDTGYSVSGKVMLDNFGIMAPLLGSVVKIVGTNLGVVTKEPSGDFLIDKLNSGSYKISVSAASYPSLDTSVTIINESLYGLVFTLKVVCENYNSEAAEKDIRNNTKAVIG